MYVCGRGLTDESEIIKFLQHGTLVGLLPVPHPILIRKYQVHFISLNSFTAVYAESFVNSTWCVQAKFSYMYLLIVLFDEKEWVFFLIILCMFSFSAVGQQWHSNVVQNLHVGNYLPQVKSKDYLLGVI